MGKKSGSKPKPSEQEKALAKVAKAKFDIYEQNYRPLVKKRLHETTLTEDKVNTAKGLAHADIMSGNKGRDADITRAGLRGGLGIGDSRAVLSRAAGQRAEDVVGGHAAAGSRRGVQSVDRAGKMEHINLGHGLASQSQASMSTLARNATSSAIQNAQSDLVKSDSLMTGLGNFAGFAYGKGGFGQKPAGG